MAAFGLDVSECREDDDAQPELGDVVVAMDGGVEEIAQDDVHDDEDDADEEPDKADDGKALADGLEHAADLFHIPVPPFLT